MAYGWDGWTNVFWPLHVHGRIVFIFSTPQSFSKYSTCSRLLSLTIFEDVWAHFRMPERHEYFLFICIGLKFHCFLDCDWAAFPCCLITSKTRDVSLPHNQISCNHLLEGIPVLVTHRYVTKIKWLFLSCGTYNPNSNEIGMLCQR